MAITKETIFVVDDDKLIARSLRELLQVAGFDAEAFFDAPSARPLVLRGTSTTCKKCRVERAIRSNAASACPSLPHPPDKLAGWFDIEPDDEWVPRFNIAPSQIIPVTRQLSEEPKRFGSKMRWGLIPLWAKNASIGHKLPTSTSSPCFWDRKHTEKSPSV